MECILGKMGIGMRESGNSALNMGRVLIYLEMEIHIQGNTKKVNLMGEVSILGRMLHFMWENLRMD